MRTYDLFARREGTSILRHVVTIGLVCLVIGLLLVEIGPIIWNKISILQDAEDIAATAAREYKLGHGSVEAKKSYALSQMGKQLQQMGYSPEEITKSSVQFLPPDNPTKVRVTLTKQARTLLTRHISWLDKLSVVQRTDESSI